MTLAAMNTYLFSLVSMGTGIEDWKLDTSEADALGSVMADCARALPSKKFKAVEQLLGQVAPWIGLVGTAAVVLTPRIRAHRYVRAAQSGRIRPRGAGNAEGTIQEHGPDAASGGHATPASATATPNGDAAGNSAALSGDAAGGSGVGGQGHAILGVLE